MTDKCNCNKCLYMQREELDDVHDGAFKALCEIFFLKTSVAIKPRTVSFRAYTNVPITPPEWCPLKPENRNKPKVYDISKVYQENSAKIIQRKTEEAEKAAEEKKKAEDMLPRRTEWSEFKIGADYIIPRVDLKPCKTVRVVEQEGNKLKVKEVDDNGFVTAYVNTIFEDDIEAKVMSLKRKF